MKQTRLASVLVVVVLLFAATPTVWSAGDGLGNWAYATAMTSRRAQIGAAQAKGYIYVPGGSQETGVFNSEEGASWIAQNSGTSQDLNAVTAVDGNHAWVSGGRTQGNVGSGGIIIHTNDGGATWQTQLNYPSQDLRSISAANTSVAWAAGTSGTILATRDGGATWTSQPSGVSYHLVDIAAVDPNTAWAVGDGGTIIKTTNGATWTRQSSGTPYALIAVAALDANTAWAVGYYQTIIKTTDGGNTWVRQYTGTDNYLYEITAADANTAWAVGQTGVILKTTDGGALWTRQTGGTTQDLDGVNAVSASTAWSVGKQGVIIKTTDGGATWAQQQSGTTNFLLDVTSVNAGAIVWAVGRGGTILRQQTESDTTPPATEISLSPPPNAAGWNKDTVAVTLNATDNAGGSGVKEITYYATGAQPIPTTVVNGATAQFDVTAEGVTALSFFATDNANQSHPTTTVDVKIDLTAPTISGTPTSQPNENGWYTGPVSVGFVCDDAESGIASCDGDTTLRVEGANQSVTGTATDRAGNRAQATVDGINIDLTPPVVSYSNNLGTYYVDQMVNITYRATDNLSGIDSQTGGDIVGPAYSFDLGTNTRSGTAIDRAGNHGTGSAMFTVRVTYGSLANLAKMFAADPGIANALASKLSAAEAASVRGNAKAKDGAIGAFVNQVEAQTGKSLTQEQARVLITLARSL